MNRKKLLKAGRFAFLLPYIIMFSLFLAEGSDIGSGFAAALLCAFVFFFALESPIVLIYPVCWIISIFCFIRYGKLLNAEKDQAAEPEKHEQLEQEQSDNKGCLILIACLAAFFLLVIIVFAVTFSL